MGANFKQSTHSTINFGLSIEKLVENYLLKRGFKKITNNYRVPAGEIDLVMQDQNVLVFIEVRYRGTTAYSSGLESVTRLKQQRLIKAARSYLKDKQLTEHTDCRFDVVSVTGEQAPYEIHWLPNAFLSY